MTESAPANAEPSPIADVYEDAELLSRDYPVRHLPTGELIDRLVTESRWHELSEELSSHGGLTRLFAD